MSLIERAMVDDPPFALKDGGFIRAGFDAELDEIRAMKSHAKDWIAQFEAGERRRTGIHSLKVRYNRVFGYYIEVTQSNLKSVPADYMRKQTLANGERYITPELKEYEAKVLNAESLIEKLETALLTRVREEVAAHYPALKRMADALAVLDVLAALAEVAEAHHFIRPEIDSSVALSIREGRHPVVENTVGRGAFVANDCRIDPSEQQIILLTGPNMAGKSTYMRQVALIVILAQMGSFVPCSRSAYRHRRSHFYPHRRGRFVGARRVDVHGRNERDCEYLAPCDGAQFDSARRSGAGHEHLRRHLDRLGGGRGIAR